MSRKKRPPRPEILTRNVEIISVKARASVGAAREGKREPTYEGSASLELRGTLDEPVRDLREIEFVLYPKDDPGVGREPVPWVALVTIAPDKILRPAVFLAHQDFDRIWALAMAGLLKHSDIALTEPRHRKAFALYVSFSTRAAMAALDVDPDDVYIRIVDVGPGLCAVVTVPGGSSMVYDAGHWNGQHCIRAVRELIPGEAIDLLVISHSDADHLGDAKPLALGNTRGLHRGESICWRLTKACEGHRHEWTPYGDNVRLLPC